MLTLSTVIMRLSDKRNNTPVPFRDSKLTRLLQPALEGNSKVSIICNISSFTGSHAETLSTVNFAKRAKKIKQVIKTNEIQDGNSLISKYQQEIADLQRKLQEMSTRLEGEVTVNSKLDYSNNLIDLIEKKEEAEERVDRILQEKLMLEKELKMMKSFILNADEIKPGKRLLNPEVLKGQVMKSLLNKIVGKPILNGIDIPNDTVDKSYARRESLLTDGIDEILGQLRICDDESTGLLGLDSPLVEVKGCREERGKGEEGKVERRKGEEVKEVGENEKEKERSKSDKEKIEEQERIIFELKQALRDQDGIIRKMTEIIEDKTSEVDLLKEEIKMHKRNAVKMNVAAKFGFLKAGDS